MVKIHSCKSFVVSWNQSLVAPCNSNNRNSSRRGPQTLTLEWIESSLSPLKVLLEHLCPPVAVAKVNGVGVDRLLLENSGVSLLPKALTHSVLLR